LGTSTRFHFGYKKLVHSVCRLWYGEPNVISRTIEYAKFFSRFAKQQLNGCKATGALAGSAEVPSAKRRPNGGKIRFKWYEKIDLPVGYVGLVRSVRAKDNDCQSACRKERK
jgi:hypothetical protein